MNEEEFIEFSRKEIERRGVASKSPYWNDSDSDMALGLVCEFYFRHIKGKKEINEAYVKVLVRKIIYGYYANKVRNAVNKVFKEVFIY